MADDRPRTPKPVAPEGGDTRKQSLGGDERFVLSRIDGQLDEEELSVVTGIPFEDVRSIVDVLASVGLVRIDGRAMSAPALRAPTPPPTPAASASAPSVPEIDDGVDLELSLRQRVNDLHARLGGLDHYGVLGVTSSADKKAIKRAYFEYVSVFHPDKYFRKRLGPFKAKMAEIFNRATFAHDTLTDKAKRADYDAYLEDRRRARGIEDLLEDALAQVAAAEQAVRSSVPEPGTSQAAPQPAPAVRPAPIPTPQRVAAVTHADAQARRDALARRLLGTRPRTPSSPDWNDAGTPPPQTVAGAMDALRRRHDERISAARSFESKKYLDAADAARAKGDPVAVANALRVAHALAPSDAALKRRYEEAQAAADKLLAETYTRQAAYEEKAEQWSAAAKSWERVARGRPEDAHAHERAANAMVRAGGELHEASRLALRACELDPTSAKPKVTLANVYMAAGLSLNAKRELEAAARIAPHDDTIVNLLKRVSKGA